VVFPAGNIQPATLPEGISILAMGQGFAVITSERSDYLRALYGIGLYWFCRCETAAVWRFGRHSRHEKAGCKTSGLHSCFCAAGAASESLVLFLERFHFLAFTAQSGNRGGHGHNEHDADECCENCQDREHGGVPFFRELRSSSSVLTENAYGASRSERTIYLGSIDFLIVIESDCGSQHARDHYHPEHVNHRDLARHLCSLPAALTHLICVDHLNASVFKRFRRMLAGCLPIVI
jgi:hypothetical protein